MVYRNIASVVASCNTNQKNFDAKIFNRQKKKSAKIKCLLCSQKPQKLLVKRYMYEIKWECNRIFSTLIIPTLCPESELSLTAMTPTDTDISLLPNKISSNCVKLPGEAYKRFINSYQCISFSLEKVLITFSMAI